MIHLYVLCQIHKTSVVFFWVWVLIYFFSLTLQLCKMLVIFSYYYSFCKKKVARFNWTVKNIHKAKSLLLFLNHFLCSILLYIFFIFDITFTHWRTRTISPSGTSKNSTAPTRWSSWVWWFHKYHWDWGRDCGSWWRSWKWDDRKGSFKSIWCYLSDLPCVSSQPTLCSAFRFEMYWKVETKSSRR